MFNPEMMKMASDMMSKLTPEQMAQMQRQMANMPPEFMQQAMQAAQNATPEQIRQMQAAAAGMSGDDLTRQAAAGVGQQAGQLKYLLDASAQLKAEGNRLHGAKRYSEAAEKYERAIANLQGHTSGEARDLRTSCQSNLASCFLQLERWQECVDMCGRVLGADASNRKALYRRGQALCALGRYDAAVDDLRQAVQLSPESEKDIIREKLADAEQKQRQASQGVVIEEVTEPAAADEQPAGADQQQEGLAESDTDDEMPPLEQAPAAAAAAPAAAAAAAGGVAGGAGFGAQPFVPPGLDPQRVQQTAEMLKNNPEMARQAAAAMSAMSDEQIAALAAQGGMPGMTPEMAKQAAAMMRTMAPDQLAAVAEQAQAAMSGGSVPVPPPAFAVPSPPAAAAAASAAAGATAVAAAGSAGQAAAAVEALRQNPDMVKQAAAMMESMPEEELQRMAAMMPGAAGMQVDAAQMKMAAKMMAGMSAEDLERMSRMAASMGITPPAGTAATAAAPAGSAGGSGSAGAAVPGAPPPGFDPSSLPAGMVADMRKRMQDPEMLKMMKGMMKGMDPAQLAEMMRASGLSVTPEQARTMVDQLDKVSDKHLELIARLMGYVSAVAAAYRRAKEWVFSQGALAIAVAVLLLALLLRWLGWV